MVTRTYLREFAFDLRESALNMTNIKSLFKNEVTRKILLFYSENPQAIDTAKGISVWTGCDLDPVQKTLNILVKEGVLINHRTASTDAYAYTNKRDIVKRIERYIQGMESPEPNKLSH